MAHITSIPVSLIKANEHLLLTSFILPLGGASQGGKWGHLVDGGTVQQHTFNPGVWKVFSEWNEEVTHMRIQTMPVLGKGKWSTKFWGRNESDMFGEQQEGKFGWGPESKRRVTGDEARKLAGASHQARQRCHCQSMSVYWVLIVYQVLV